MKIISWNVNGIRACVEKGFFNFLESENPDIICLQETKLQIEQAKPIIDSCNNYNFCYNYWNCADKKGYSGTAIFSQTKPENITYNIEIEEHGHEGRVITAEYDEFYLVTVYTPNSQNGLKRLDYRIRWEDDFRAYIKKLDDKKPVIICGDMNVAHNEIDLKNPKSNRKNAGFTDEERCKMTELLNAGFVDSFRYLYPDVEDVYSWWSYRFNARANNAGWRIDYFIVSQRFKDRIKDAKILTNILGSDHCPVVLEIE